MELSLWDVWESLKGYMSKLHRTLLLIEHGWSNLLFFILELWEEHTRENRDAVDAVKARLADIDEEIEDLEERLYLKERMILRKGKQTHDEDLL